MLVLFFAFNIGSNEFVSWVRRGSFAKVPGICWYLSIGISLAPLSKPRKSVDFASPIKKALLKCIFELYALPIEIDNSLLVGKSFVTMSITPPVKSAGYSAAALFITIIFSRIFVGNISICIVFLSGSRPGISTPFKMDFVYLSPRPRTYTYLPPCTETPGTALTAPAILLAPAFLIPCDEIPSSITVDFF